MVVKKRGKDSEMAMILTIHEPSRIGRDVAFGDDEVYVGESLNHVEKQPFLVCAVDLDHGAVFEAFVVNAHPSSTYKVMSR